MGPECIAGVSGSPVAGRGPASALQGRIQYFETPEVFFL